jgi:putative ABC transport system permease protein
MLTTVALSRRRVTAVQPAPPYNGAMYFFTYLSRELRRRARQAVFIALGLAIGVGLVITVTAASAGVKNAQADVLEGLYGVGTDVTVTGAAPSPPKSGSGGGTRVGIEMGPGGGQLCVNGKCRPLKDGYTIDTLAATSYGPVSDSDVAKVAALRGVTAAAGGLLLTDNRATISQTAAQPVSFTVDGTGTADSKLGPLSDAVLTGGHAFTPADADKNVALVDKNYATANNLRTGGTMKVGGTTFTIIGLVTQPGGSNPPDVYIPLARAQALAGSGPAGTGAGSLKNDVNTIYVTAASAADINTVSSEISRLLPTATVTTPSSLASEVTGSVTSAAKLAGDLGTWLTIGVLIAAFAVAVLLTMAAVARRVREFGTLKALGWRGGRIIAQVMGESLAVGVLGAAAGVGLGYAGAAIINAVAPRLSATLTEATGQHIMTPSGAVDPTATHTVSVPLSATVAVTMIGLAVLLALGGGLLAGMFGSWRIGRLRPADALTKVA